MKLGGLCGLNEVLQIMFLSDHEVSNRYEKEAHVLMVVCMGRVPVYSIRMGGMGQE